MQAPQNNPEPFLDSSFIERAVGHAAAQRGRKYWKNGQVLTHHCSHDDVYRGTVQGNRARPYKITVALEHTQRDGWDIADSTCSCPMAYDCKHVAALLFAALAANRAAEAAPSSGPPKKRVATAKVNAPAAMTWLQNMQSAVQAPPETALPESGRHFLYIINNAAPEAIVATLTLSVSKARRLKSGGYGALSPATLYRGMHYNEYNFDDRALTEIFTLDDMATKGGTRYIYNHNDAKMPQDLSGYFGFNVLHAVVETGRSYFTTVTSSPLRWGPDKQAALMWHRLDDGSQALRSTLPPSWQIVNTAPLCYVDAQTGTVGRLHLPIPDVLLAQLNDAPPVPLDELESFCAGLPEALRDVLPQPRHVPVQERVVAPVPILETTVCDTDAGRQIVARLAFLYGETKLGVKEKRQELFVEEDSILYRIRRDAKAEKAALAAVKSLKFPALPRTHEYDFTVASTPTLQDVYAAKTAILDPLGKAGWVVTGDLALTQTIIELDDPWDIGIDAEENSPWFSVEMGIDVEGVHHNLTPILTQALSRPELGLSPEDLEKNNHPRIYVPINAQQTISMPAARLRQIFSVLQELYSDRPKLGASHAVDLLQLEELGGCALRGGAFIMALAKRLRGCQGMRPVQAPAELRATLRPYQLQGVAWLQFLREFDLAGLLADDMGLGKTLQTLAHVLIEKQEGRLTQPALVVVPTSLLFNWQEEIKRFAPSLRVHTFYGATRHAALQDSESFDVCLTTYGVLLRDVDAMAKKHFHLVILDESHVIKNPRSKLHAAAKRIDATHRLALTGTPMQNNLAELWAQFNFLMPPLLDDEKSFKKSFRDPIEKLADERSRSQLQNRIRPFILRRTKDEVVSELPNKTEILHSVHLQGRQRDLYEAVRVSMDERVRREVHAKGMARSSIVVLDALLKLRQVCCDPRLMKLEAAKRVKGSAKLDLLLELLIPMVQEGRRILVFSQFTSMLDLIAGSLEKLSVAYRALTGKTRNRQSVVEEFQNGAIPVLLISLKAGGTGLNLTRADTVIHYDPWWNPSVEQQATDRAHRIGQDKAVFVYKLIVAGSVEERIVELQKRKQKLADTLLQGGALQTLLTKEELTNLFAPLTRPSGA